MSGLDHERNVEQFEERLRRWGGRPPALAPAFAASRVIGQLPGDRRAGVPWLRLATVTAMLALVTVTVWVSAPPRREPAPATVLGSDQVVQFWLDSETPIYFVLPPFGGASGGNS